jgi:hypothetical protein
VAVERVLQDREVVAHMKESADVLQAGRGAPRTPARQPLLQLGTGTFGKVQEHLGPGLANATKSGPANWEQSIVS